MKNKLLYILGGLAVLVLVVFFSVELFLGSIVTAAVNRIAPTITQTKVELKSAHISPLSGSGTLTGLAVGNPKGWSDGNAFYLGKIHISVQPFSIFGDHIIVNEILIDEPQFTYETKIVSSNINDLLKNVEATAGDKSTGAQPTAKNGKPIKFEVRHFKMTNGKVTLGVGKAALPLPMPPIELTDLGTKEGGITPDRLAFAVMRSVTSGVVSATTQAATQIGSTAGAAAAEGAKRVGEGIKGLFGGKP